MARPRGEIAGEVMRAVSELSSGVAGSVVGTWRDLYNRLIMLGVQASAKVVRWTVENMAARKQLVSVGAVRVAGSRRPMKLYGVPVEQASTVSLSSVMSLWGSPVVTP